MNLTLEKKILPEFPRTKHLPIEPNASRDDLVASEEELEFVLNHPNIIIEEKIDGSNCGMTEFDSYPLIRNRTHILNKAYTGNTKTPAKQQFASIWTWWYENANKFRTLEKTLGFHPSVYGEWMFAKHTIEHYNLLPSTFIAFDIYNWKIGKFLAPEKSYPALAEAEFKIVPILTHDNTITRQKLIELRDGYSSFSTDGKREGIYIRLSDGKYTTHRYKMVSPEFKSSDDWNKKPLMKNKIVKK